MNMRPYCPEGHPPFIRKIEDVLIPVNFFKKNECVTKMWVAFVASLHDTVSHATTQRAQRF
jgi:hypothetical protein